MPAIPQTVLTPVQTAPTAPAQTTTTQTATKPSPQTPAMAQDSVSTSQKSAPAKPVSEISFGDRLGTASKFGLATMATGAIIGAIVIAFAETLLIGLTPLHSSYKDSIAFAILITVLLIKPYGLFGGRKEEVESR